MSSPIDESVITPETCQIGDLCIGHPLSLLTEKEKQFATYLILSTWANFPILLRQVSLESVQIFEFLGDFIPSYTKEQFEAATGPLLYALQYAGWFYHFCGNYRGSGDLKFIPRLSKDEFRSLCKGESLAKLEKCIDAMYNPTPTTLGFYPKAYTAYYQPNEFTQDEEKAIDALLAEKKIRVENTMIVREGDRYLVTIASVDKKEEPVGIANGRQVILQYGRGSEYLQKSIVYLEKAKEFATSQIQIDWLTHLINSYQTGSIPEHVHYSEKWVQDVNPAVESHLGFIESYRDPAGLRAEYEGVVACVDREESKVLHDYVAASSTILGLLPYPKIYERENFMPPSYNALKVLSCCSTFDAIGINIPNYDEVRLTLGFKNVTLTNVMKAKEDCSGLDDRFLPRHFVDTFAKLSGHTQNAHVASHELYGHGSGRYLFAADLGKAPDLLHPGQTIQTCYPEGCGMEKTFGGMAASFEECRAETIAMYLMLHDEVLKIFGFAEADYKNAKLTEIYYMVRRALFGLEYYHPDDMVWTQAHSRGRFVILSALIQWGNETFKIIEKDGRFEMFIDEERGIEGVKQALKTLLLHITAYKSTNQPAAAHTFYTQMSLVDTEALRIKKAVESQPPGTMLTVGAVVDKKGDGYELHELHNGKKTLYDSVWTNWHNTRVSMGIE